jgi:hypothetical protein
MMRVMKHIFFLFIFLFLAVPFVSAQAGVRLSDDDIKKMINEASETADKFRDAFKKVQSITTTSGMQVDVKQYMNDYKETFQKFKDAFDKQGVPGIDFVNLLRMTNEIDGVMTRNPDAAGAGSEWQAHKFNMDKIAKAFRTSLGEGAAPPKRMSDQQMKALMEQLKEGSKTLGKAVKDAMKKDPSIDKATSQKAEQSLKTLEKSAETVGKLFNDNKPLSAEMEAFLKQMDVVKSFLGEHQFGPAVQSEWDKLEGKSRQMADEYSMTS